MFEFNQSIIVLLQNRKIVFSFKYLKKKIFTNKSGWCDDVRSYINPVFTVSPHDGSTKIQQYMLLSTVF